MASQVSFFNNYQAMREIVKFNNFPFSKNGPHVYQFCYFNNYKVLNGSMQWSFYLINWMVENIALC